MTEPSRCGLVVIPRFVADAPLEMRSLSPAEAALELMRCNLNARNLRDGGLRAISALSRAAPCITLRYGGFHQLEGVLDRVIDFLLDRPLDASTAHRLLAPFAPKVLPAAPAAPAKKVYAIPKATPRGGPRRLTIGMATYDDYDGVYFSVQALRLYHPEVLDDIEIVVVDNNPDGPCAEALKALDASIPGYRYIPQKSTAGTAARQQVFAEASGEMVICIDSHVMLVPGAVSRLLAYCDANPQSRDLLQGPMLGDGLSTFFTHYNDEWRGGFYGTWASDPRAIDPDAPPFEIMMQGLGAFACRREAWPGFNPRFRGYGGEEGYLHEKIRQRGGRVLCLPFMRWLHRSRRPFGLPYRHNWEDRMHNYSIGFRELGLPLAPMVDHFRTVLGATTADRIFEQIALEIGEEAESDQRGAEPTTSSMGTTHLRQTTEPPITKLPMSVLPKSAADLLAG